MNLTAERAVRRFLQIQTIEQTVKDLEARILDKQKQLQQGEEELGELRKSKSDLMKQMREAANDEGQLPLFEEELACLV
jgi:predicted  nucleic acid-binding Zn-ribbon protein